MCCCSVVLRLLGNSFSPPTLLQMLCKERSFIVEQHNKVESPSPTVLFSSHHSMEPTPTLTGPCSRYLHPGGKQAATSCCSHPGANTHSECLLTASFVLIHLSSLDAGLLFFWILVARSDSLCGHWRTPAGALMSIHLVVSSSASGGGQRRRQRLSEEVQLDGGRSG